MSTANATVDQKSDPFQAVAAAMNSAAQAVRDGATDARETVAQAIPGAGKFVSRTVYTSCYFLSYGVVFPTMLVANVLPKCSPVQFGFSDGASAAKDAASQLKEQSLAWRTARREAHEGRRERSEIVTEGVEAMAIA